MLDAFLDGAKPSQDRGRRTAHLVGGRLHCGFVPVRMRQRWTRVATLFCCDHYRTARAQASEGPSESCCSSRIGWERPASRRIERCD